MASLQPEHTPLQAAGGQSRSQGQAPCRHEKGNPAWVNQKDINNYTSGQSSATHTTTHTDQSSVYTWEGGLTAMSSSKEKPGFSALCKRKSRKTFVGEKIKLETIIHSKINQTQTDSTSSLIGKA